MIHDAEEDHTVEIGGVGGEQRRGLLCISHEVRVVRGGFADQAFHPLVGLELRDGVRHDSGGCGGKVEEAEGATNNIQVRRRRIGEGRHLSEGVREGGRES